MKKKDQIKKFLEEERSLVDGLIQDYEDWLTKSDEWEEYQLRGFTMSLSFWKSLRAHNEMIHTKVEELLK